MVLGVIWTLLSKLLKIGLLQAYTQDFYKPSSGFESFYLASRWSRLLFAKDAKDLLNWNLFVLLEAKCCLFLARREGALVAAH